MDDDFNTPQAVAALFDLAREINHGRDEGLDVGEAQETLQGLAGVLGLKLRVDVTIRPPIAEAFIEGLPAEVVVESWVKERDELRKAKQWQRADEVRNKFKQWDIILEDTSQETILSYKGKIWRRYPKP
jgi:cysteinyl-tRNA synthetase